MVKLFPYEFTRTARAWCRRTADGQIDETSLEIDEAREFVVNASGGSWPLGKSVNVPEWVFPSASSPSCSPTSDTFRSFVFCFFCGDDDAGCFLLGLGGDLSPPDRRVTMIVMALLLWSFGDLFPCCLYCSSDFAFASYSSLLWAKRGGGVSLFCDFFVQMFSWFCPLAIVVSAGDCKF